ncbi:anthranilate phosphoribosyltransferase [Oharaeibacter diazotrophicus]|uniref:Anthranilate phosphoribosyltransferase n=1 Tax=Oharaeibacter diazotrophicus TaxID=1920512 RepID=A0A4R6RN00_9HYPH|nr:anthranilate phosphoribosyltransferase [Oharaeibacter diazotrophicus]TDP87427.1 anthranilate phosphoribosyltransferase [Oharaeibacter diazotrophicus]BBE70629.1 anthranilate phosphoribosyltransferase [Pleomorphomonas sp. SM30]GLS77375.1 anthranilate phosphoribosyltransferase [Oharaeibacter diazotrophicus]
MADFKAFINKVAGGNALSREEARAAFDVMMSGEATPAQIGGFLMALRVRGETVDEIAGAVETMRAKMLRVEAPAEAIDIVGTGGDATGSLNISTASAFVTAAAGVPVAKHGNRALSSKSGAADVLMALGVKIDVPAETIGRAIAEVGVGFMFAPAHHAAMRHVGPSRVELGTRTIFNLLGPLSNPAGVRRQLVGVFARAWVEPIARVLGTLGSEAALVVHGSDGMDEITCAGRTHVSRLEGGEVVSFEISPEDAGLPIHPPGAVAGGNAEENAVALRRLLEGAPGAYRDTVLMNAGAALMVAGRAATLAEGVVAAAAAIDDGRALDKLDRLVALTNADDA